MKKRLADYRVRVVDQYPPEVAEKAVEDMAREGFLLQSSWPVTLAGDVVQHGMLAVHTQKAALYCVFARPADAARRLPGDEWKGLEDEE